ncbi:protein Wnt-7b [Ciona intestinalis]
MDLICRNFVVIFLKRLSSYGFETILFIICIIQIAENHTSWALAPAGWAVLGGPRHVESSFPSHFPSDESLNEEIPKRNVTINLPLYCSKGRRALSHLQWNICSLDASSAVAADQGYWKAIKLCETEFKYEKWNCSLVLPRSRNHKRNTSRFNDGVLPIGLEDTKEAAYYYAITRAGIAHSITRSCSTGAVPGKKIVRNLVKYVLARKICFPNLPTMFQTGCKCYEGFKTRNFVKHVHNLCSNPVEVRVTGNYIRSKSTSSVELPHGVSSTENCTSDVTWEWRGCSDNINYGVRQSKKWFEPNSKRRKKRLMTSSDKLNLHNANVGRRVYEDLTALNCVCSGLSGSCALRTCWKRHPDLRVVAEELKKLYKKARPVVLATQTRNPTRYKITSRLLNFDFLSLILYKVDVCLAGSGRVRKLFKKELAYFNRTPDLCEPDEMTGSLGTKKRECKLRSNDAGDCRRLCCRRGFYDVTKEITYTCNCQFHFCCRVTCQVCRRGETLHICNG